MLKRMIKMPYIITSHGDCLPQSSRRMASAAARKLCRRILQQADAVTHLNQFMAHASHAIQDTTEKSIIIPNGIEPARWQAFHDKGDGYYLLAIGRLVREKGFDVVLEAYASLVKHKGVTLPLVIAGKGEMQASLMRQAEGHGLPVFSSLPDINTSLRPSVYFPGFLSDEKKYKLYANARLVLFPTQPHLVEEAFGLIILESMAAAKPLIMSRLAVTADFLRYGMQVEVVNEPANPAGWIEKMKYLLDNLSLCRQYGEHNYRLTALFEWKQIAKQYLQVYQRVIAVA